jgi:hypothetical protein
MHGTLFDIGLGLGLSSACGLRPYLPSLLAGALASAPALGVRFGGHFRFLQSGWWLLAVALVLALGYLLALRLTEQRLAPATSVVLGALALSAGALLFAGTLAAHHDEWWPGLLGGAAAAALARAAVVPVVRGARSRLGDRAAREAVTVYLDGASLALAALVAVLHPLGYLAPVLLGWLLARVRSRAQSRYAGLRIMRR